MHPTAERLAYMQDYRKKRKYGLTQVQVEEMIAQRGGLCDICQQPETRERNGKLLPLCVDHDAVTGVVRGILCGKCNVGIGMLAHSVNRMQQAISYLERGVTDGKV